MKTTIRLLADLKVGEETFKAGEFVEVEADFAKTQIEAKIAEAKTPAEYAAEQAVIKQKEAAQKVTRIQVIDREDQDPKDGFKSFSHFISDVIQIGTNQRPSEIWQRYLTKAVGSDEMASRVGATGGFLIPAEFRATLLQTALEAAVVRPRATVIPMASATITIPAINETTRATAGTTRGGIAVAYVGETDQKTGSKPALRTITLTLHTLYSLCYVTNQLLQYSAISLETLLPQMFAQSIAFEEDYNYFWGTGAAQPLGFLTGPAPGVVSVTKETNQAAATVVSENIIKMYSRMAPESVGRAVWVANPETFPQLATMTISVGTGGVPAWLPGNSIAGAPNGTLFGKPLILSEKCAALGTQGDIIFADFSQYFIGAQGGGGLRTDLSIHLRFDYNETCFRFEMEHDGQLSWSSPITPRKGSATISPIIVLDTRA